MVKPSVSIGLALIAASLVPLKVSAVQPYFDLSIDLGHDDNIGRAQQSADILSDRFLAAAASANLRFLLGEKAGLTLKAQAEQVKHQSYQGLDHLNLGVKASFKLKPDLSYSAPWYSLSLAYTDARYQSALRDGSIFDAELTVGKRFTDRILAKVGLGYSERDAEVAASPFDFQNRSLFAGADYHYGKFTLYAEHRYIDGPLVSTSGPNANLGMQYYQLRAVDDAIGADSQGNTRYAYRIDAKTQLTDLGVNYAVSRGTAVDFALRNVDTDASGNNAYDSFSAHLGLYFRFK